MLGAKERELVELRDQLGQATAQVRGSRVVL
jgi:hypothetical protein